MRDKAAYDTLIPMKISSWQTDLQSSIHKYQDLLLESGLKNDSKTTPDASLSTFPTRVPQAYLSRIDKNNPEDPLLLQVLPTIDEDKKTPGFKTDAVGEIKRHLTAGLIKKYHGRALMITTAACAIHCRYCFRRHYPYEKNQASQENWSNAITALQADPGIFEIILSGGDPLSLSDEKLESLILKLGNIPHLKFLRIHTRFPVVVPSRVTKHLLETLKHTRLKTSVVLHINHPNEIDADVRLALNAFHHAGLQLLNQSVLLKGVNDDAEVLTKLSESIYSNHVLPYYLHLLDPIEGAAHFEVDESVAHKIMEQLRTRLPGYLVPRLVKEVPDAPYKIPLG